MDEYAAELFQHYVTLTAALKSFYDWFGLIELVYT